MALPLTRRARSLVALGVASVVVGAVVGVAGAWAWAATRPPVYASTTTLMVALPGAGAASELDALRGRTILAPSFATMAVTPASVRAVSDALGLGDEADAVIAGANARAEAGSAQLSITARYHDPAVAAAIANGLAAQVVARAGGDGASALAIIEPAAPAAAPDGPPVPLELAIGAVVGVTVAVGGLVLVLGIGRRRRGTPDEPAADRASPGIATGVVLGVAVLAALAMELPDSVTLVVSAIAVAASALLPGAGFAALAVLMPHQEPAVLGALGINLPIIAATTYGCLVRMAAERRVPSAGVGPVIIVGLLGIALVSAVPALNGLTGDRAVASAARFLQLAQGLVLVGVGAHWFARHDARPVLAVALVSATFAGALAVLQLVVAGGAVPLLHGLYVAGADEAVARVTGPFLNPNYFGLFAGLGLVLALGLAMAEPRHRTLALLALPVLGIAVLGTLSRGSLAAAACGVLVWLWFRNRQVAAVAAVGLVVSAVLAGPVLVDARLGGFSDDLPSAQAGVSASDQQRLESVAAGTSLFRIDPLFGVGFGQYEYVSPRFVGNSPATSAHNQYLKVLAEQGIVGTALYAAAAVSLLLVLRRTRSAWRQTAVSMAAVYAVSGLFLEPLTTFQTSGLLWLVLGVTLSASAVRLARQEPVPAAVAIPLSPPAAPLPRAVT